MSVVRRELYSSPNGDRWFLVREKDSGRVFVSHEANVPSGGKIMSIEIGAFLGSGGEGPEHQALLRLSATLVDDRADARLDDSGNSDRTVGVPYPDNGNVRPPEGWR